MTSCALRARKAFWRRGAVRPPIPPSAIAWGSPRSDLIAQLPYAPYFLTVHDIVRFARSQGILAQGRGSAANSAVCYCLGITEVRSDRTASLCSLFPDGA